MQKLIKNVDLTFRRSFAIWAYCVGHRQLLLRSVCSEQCPTRVDVYFHNVRWMSLPSSFDCLSIKDVGFDQALSFGAKLDEQMSLGSQAYAFIFDATIGVVVASHLAWHEDEGSYSDPSPLDLWIN